MGLVFATCALSPRPLGSRPQHPHQDRAQCCLENSRRLVCPAAVPSHQGVFQGLAAPEVRTLTHGLQTGLQGHRQGSREGRGWPVGGCPGSQRDAWKSLRKLEGSWWVVPGTRPLLPQIMTVCAFPKSPLGADAAHLPPRQPCLGPALPRYWAGPGWGWQDPGEPPHLPEDASRPPPPHVQSCSPHSSRTEGPCDPRSGD